MIAGDSIHLLNRIGKCVDENYLVKLLRQAEELCERGLSAENTCSYTVSTPVKENLGEIQELLLDLCSMICTFANSTQSERNQILSYLNECFSYETYKIFLSIMEKFCSKIPLSQFKGEQLGELRGVKWRLDYRVEISNLNEFRLKPEYSICFLTNEDTQRFDFTCSSEQVQEIVELFDDATRSAKSLQPL